MSIGHISDGIFFNLPLLKSFMILFNNLLMTFGCDSDTSNKSKGRYIESGRRSFTCCLVQISNLPSSIKRPPLERDLKLASTLSPVKEFNTMSTP